MAQAFMEELNQRLEKTTERISNPEEFMKNLEQKLENRRKERQFTQGPAQVELKSKVEKMRAKREAATQKAASELQKTMVTVHQVAEDLAAVEHSKQKQAALEKVSAAIQLSTAGNPENEPKTFFKQVCDGLNSIIKKFGPILETISKPLFWAIEKIAKFANYMMGRSNQQAAGQDNAGGMPNRDGDTIIVTNTSGSPILARGGGGQPDHVAQEQVFDAIAKHSDPKASSSWQTDEQRKQSIAEQATREAQQAASIGVQNLTSEVAKKMEEAATKIQSTFRGSQARKDIREEAISSSTKENLKYGPMTNRETKTAVQRERRQKRATERASQNQRGSIGG